MEIIEENLLSLEEMKKEKPEENITEFIDTMQREDENINAEAEYLTEVDMGAEAKPIKAEDFLPVLVGVWMKMSPEIRHGYRILRELLSEKSKSILEPFLGAVDPKEFPDYYETIKEPMDLFKISEKFHNTQYSSITEVVADMRQIIENCFKYNGMESYISKQARKFEVILEQKINLLSRELRSKTTIAETNKLKDKEHLNSLLFTSGGRRMNFKVKNGESSLIAMQMQLQEELEEKERKRLKGKEKKEMNDALEEECEKWSKDFLNDEVMGELTTTWEIPAVGIYICILKDFLNLQEINYSEFEMGVLFPKESSLVAKIFTSLLVTPFQRRRLNSTEPMKYSVWSEKVRSKILSWYKVASTSGQEYAASLFGFDACLFDVLGYTNPFSGTLFHELPLKSRMWILKALCEAALEQDSTIRDYFGELEFIDRQDLCLGHDSAGFSYHYISQFGTTDIRIFKQKNVTNPEVPKIRDEPIIMEKIELMEKVPLTDSSFFENGKAEAVNVEAKEDQKPYVRTSSRVRTKRSLSPTFSRTLLPKKEKRRKKTSYNDFQMVVHDIQSLKALYDELDQQINIKSSKRIPENELHQSVEALYHELKKRETTFIKCNQKARMKVMLECKKTEENFIVEESNQKADDAWESENEGENGEGAKTADGSGIGIVRELPSQVGKQMCTGRLDVRKAASQLETGPDAVLSKEGRRLRSKRFDVKELFADHEQLARKRPKLEAGNPAQKKLQNDDVSCRGMNNQLQRPGNVRNFRSLSGSRTKQERNDDISESDIQILRNKRLEKIKRDLREGKVLTREEERNLFNLGLSADEIRAFKVNMDKCGAVIENPSQAETSSDSCNSANFFVSYDGLRALADIASLAQKDTTPSKTETGNQVNFKIVVKERKGSKLTVARADTSPSMPTGDSRDVKKEGNCLSEAFKVEQSSKGIQNGQSKIVVLDANEEKLKLESTEVNNSARQLTPQNQIIIVGKDNGSATNARRKTENKILIEQIKEKPVFLQRKRPNILRKPVVVIPASSANSVGLKDLKDRLPSSVMSSPGKKPTNVVIVKSESKIPGSAPATSASFIAIECKANQTVPSCSFMSNALSNSAFQMTTMQDSDRNQAVQTESGAFFPNHVTINPSGKGTDCLSNSVVPNKLIQFQQKPLIVPKTTISAIPNTSGNNFAEPVLIFSQQNRVPIVLGNNTIDRNQPVLILAATQPMLNSQQGKLKLGNSQPNKESYVVAFQHEPSINGQNSTNSRTSNISLEDDGNKVALTKCPVTTLKSKLHAAALKRKHHGKTRSDNNQSNQDIPSKTCNSAPVCVRNAEEGILRMPKIVICTTVPAVANIAPKIIQTVPVESNQISTSRNNNCSTSQMSQLNMTGLVTCCAGPCIRDAIIPSAGSLAFQSNHKANSLCAKTIHIVKEVEERSFVLTSNVNTSFYSSPSSNLKTIFPASSTDVSFSMKSKNAIIKKRIISPVSVSTRLNYQPIKPAPISTPETTLGASDSSLPQLQSTIIVDPTGLVANPVSIAAVPVISLPAQILQLPAQIPAREVVKGVAESNRGAATASQLVIVPSTRARKEIRPANDTTTAVKALKSLDQVSKPTTALNCSTEFKSASVQEDCHVFMNGALSSVVEMSPPNDWTNLSISKQQVGQANSVSPIAFEKIEVGVNSFDATAIDVSSAVVTRDSTDLQMPMISNDKSSVTYSITSPILSTEVKRPCQPSGTEKKE